MRQDTPLRRMLSSRAAKLKLPVSGGFELTPRCNLSCKMCYIHQNGNACAAQELSAERWLDMGRQAADAGVEVRAMDCSVTPASMTIDAPMTVDLALPE